MNSIGLLIVLAAPFVLVGIVVAYLIVSIGGTTRRS